MTPTGPSSVPDRIRVYAAQCDSFCLKYPHNYMIDHNLKSDICHPLHVLQFFLYPILSVNVHWLISANIARPSTINCTYFLFYCRFDGFACIEELGAIHFIIFLQDSNNSINVVLFGGDQTGNVQNELA